MALDFLTRGSVYTESANALMLPLSNRFQMLWFYVPPTPTGVFLEGSNGTDLSRYTASLTASRELVQEISNSTGTTDSNTSAPLSVGWHLLRTFGLVAAGNNWLFRVDNGGTASLLEAARPNTAFTRMTFGSKRDGTQPSNARIRQYSVGNNNLDATELTNTWNGGVFYNEATLATLVNGEIAIIPFSNDLTPTLGTVSFTRSREPLFTDDSSLTGSWTQSTFDAIPSIRNANVLYDSMNMDFMLFSDSFGAPFNARLAYQLVNELAFFAECPIKKLANGARVRAHTTDSPIVTAEQIGGSGLEDDVNDANNYPWNLDPDDTPVQMAIPMDWGLDIHMPSGTTGTYIANISAKAPSNYRASSPITSWVGASDLFGCKVLLRRGCDFVAFDNTTSRGAVTYAGDGLVPWATPEINLSVDNSGGRLLQIGPPGGSMANVVDEDFQIIGSIWNNKSVPSGIGYLSVAGGSWSVGGHYADATSDGVQPKQYTDEQINPVIRAFYTPGRKLIFVMSIATESSMNVSVQAWIDKMDERCDALNISNYGFLIISQFVHTSMATVRQSVIDFDAIAAADPRVCHVSLYKLTGGCFFHDGGEAATLGLNDANGPQQHFLEAYDSANGTTYAVTPGRVMLDASDLHLNDGPSAQFMGEILARNLFASGELGVEPPAGITRAVASDIAYSAGDQSSPVGSLLSSGVL